MPNDSNVAVILTALPVEYMAVRAHLADVREAVHQGTVYESGTFTSPNQIWRVHMAEVGAGNAATAAEAQKAIDHFNPQLVFFVGVAGGIKDVKLGDVVVATKVYGFESGKAEGKFRPRPSVGNSSHALEQRARAEARKDDWFQRIGPELPPAPPKVHVGPIAAGEKVVASTQSAIFQFIRRQYGDALAVEMEGRGFLQATHVNHPVQAIVIRGISDLVDKKSEADSSGSQVVASRHASAFALELLAKFDGGATDNVIHKNMAESPTRPPVIATAFESIARPEPEFPVFEVPLRRNPNFSGRDDTLDTLHYSFAANPEALQINVLTGLGGVGKTQIAARYAYEHADEYDLVWWIRAEDAAALAADYQALADRLQLPVKTGAEQIVFINIARDWLENTSRRWLIVFDNVEDPEWLGSLLPRRGKGHILVTSRHPDWRHLARVLPIAPFSLEAAKQFLLTRTGEKDEASAGRLAEMLGGLPLALEQAGAFITKRGTSLSSYIQLYEDQRLELWQRDTPPTDYTATLTTTWELAFRQIKSHSPAGMALLNLCAFLAPDNIPLSMIRDGGEALPQELAVTARDPLALDDAVAVLYQYSLVERKEDSLSIHRLVQEVVRERLGPKRAPKWAEVAVNLLTRIFPYDKHKVETWAPSAKLLPQVLSVILNAEYYAAAFMATGALWQKAGEYLLVQGDYAKAQWSLERALAFHKRVVGDKHPETARSLNLLGDLHHWQGHYAEARTYLESALEIRQTALGREHTDTATSLNDLGALLTQLGEYDQAHLLIEEALAIRKQVAGDSHPDTGVSLGILGGLLEAQAHYEEARQYLEGSLAIFRRVLGENHPNTADGLASLGSLLQEQGIYEEAQRCFDEALTIRKRFLGENHPSTAASISQQGNLLLAMGNYEEARRCHEEALTIRKMVFGDNHPGIAISFTSLSNLLSKEGKYEEARRHLEDALAITRQVVGENHPDTATCLSNLGVFLDDRGDYERAWQYENEALVIRRRVFDENHPAIANSLNNLGGSLCKQGKYVAARQYLEQALQIYSKVHGSNHPRLVTILTNLASALVHLKQFSLARNYVARAMAICKETNELYAECEDIERLGKSLPRPIGRGGKKKLKH